MKYLEVTVFWVPHNEDTGSLDPPVCKCLLLWLVGPTTWQPEPQLQASWPGALKVNYIRKFHLHKRHRQKVSFLHSSLPFFLIPKPWTKGQRCFQALVLQRNAQSLAFPGRNQPPHTAGCLSQERRRGLKRTWQGPGGWFWGRFLWLLSFC